MKCRKENMRLYAVTDRAWTGRQSLMEQVECALKGRDTCVKLQEKKKKKNKKLKKKIKKNKKK